MTKDEILQIAGECGIDAEKDTLCRHGGWVEPIERFAAAMYAKGAEAERAISDKLAVLLTDALDSFDDYTEGGDEWAALSRVALAEVAAMRKGAEHD